MNTIAAGAATTPSPTHGPTSGMPPTGRDGAPNRARPPRIALLGNPNTGKTTLFNRITGLRHKTSNFPGTTLEARVGRVHLGAGRRDEAPAACGCAPLVAETGESDPADHPCCEPGPRQTAVGVGGGEHDAALIDLPGLYSLELDQLESRLCRDVLAGTAAPRGDTAAAPDVICVVLDATNLARNLMLAGEALRRRLPTVVAVNMIDLARRQGLHIDSAKLSQRLGCEVVLISGRSGEGLEALKRALTAARIPSHTPPGSDAGLRRWADGIYEEAAAAPRDQSGEDTLTDHIDRAFTHPVLGVLVFVLVMGGLFYTLFSLAKLPMDLIEAAFTHVTGFVEGRMPAGILRDLLANGIVGGVAAIMVFLPQICLLFFLISLLEDTGYLARAAFVMDRALRPFGLPGHSFVPLLSSHACALPGIMATRAIPDRRERLATILVAPFMTCSARLPVYVLLIGILFAGYPGRAATAFVGCYALGIAAGVVSALLARRTILRGKSRPMALELPTYKWPSVRTALVTTYDRAWVFLRNAGTNIMLICIALWWLGAFPHVEPPAQAVELRQQAAALEGATDEGATTRGSERVVPPAVSADTSADAPPGSEPPGGGTLASGSPEENSETPAAERRATQLREEADRIERAHAKAHSFAGMLGRAIEPVFRPLGYDWQLTIGVLSSFAAREVFVSTMAVVVTGEDTDDDAGVLKEIAEAKRSDGVTPVFTRATAWSLLVYYVLAMQCLPTLAVTAREAGGVKWALLQLVWMCGVAYVAALVVYQVLA